MRIGSSAVAVCAAVCVSTGVASAQARALTLAEVLARARERAPEIVSARLAVDEARGRLLGASIRLSANPEVQGALGRRNASDRRFTDFELGLTQTFEPASRRRARIAGSTAAVARAAADLDETMRIVLRAAAGAYYRALHAAERSRLLAAAQELAASIHTMAQRRFTAGDIAVLDLNIARASLARARAEREAAGASESLAIGELKQILGLEEDIGVSGAIALPDDADLAGVQRTASERPELRALEAAVQEAEAETRLGASFARPDFSPFVRFSRDEGDRIIAGGLTLTLPVFSSGQELRAVATARTMRLREELDAARARVRIEVRAVFDAYTRRLAALRLLERDAIPGLDENETLTARSFEVGQLGLAELLSIRREILDTRSQYLDALLEAALARVALDASAGILR